MNTSQTPRCESAKNLTSDAILTVRPAQVARTLVCVIGALAVLGIASKMFQLNVDVDSFRGLREIAIRFDFDAENTVPAWYSSAALLFSSAMLALIALATRQNGGRYFWHWVVLAATFLLMSLDESASMHEILIVPLRRRLGTGGMLYFAWVIPAFFVVGIFALSYLGFLWHLPRRSAMLFIAAGAMFVGGALGLELVGGALVESQGFDSIGYLCVMTMEETLEMLGIALFIYALLDYLGQRFQRLQAGFAFPGRHSQSRA